MLHRPSRKLESSTLVYNSRSKLDMLHITIMDNEYTWIFYKLYVMHNNQRLAV